MTLYNTTTMQTKYVLEPGQCLVDYTFVWTAWANNFFVENVMYKCLYMCYGAMLMDVAMVCMLVLFFTYWKTTRLLIAIPLMFGVRGFI